MTKIALESQHPVCCMTVMPVESQHSNTQPDVVTTDPSEQRLVHKKRKMRADLAEGPQDSGERELGSPHKRVKRAEGRPQTQAGMPQGQHGASDQVGKAYFSSRLLIVPFLLQLYHTLN